MTTSLEVNVSNALLQMATECDIIVAVLDASNTADAHVRLRSLKDRLSVLGSVLQGVVSSSGGPRQSPLIMPGPARDPDQDVKDDAGDEDILTRTVCMARGPDPMEASRMETRRKRPSVETKTD